MMTNEHLDTLETEFGLQLPKWYRTFILAYPDELVTTKLDLGWAAVAPAEREFKNTLGGIREDNLHVRLPDTPWTKNDGPWSESHFIIGDDECGNYYSIDVSLTQQTVWFYDHDYGEWQPVHVCLEAFATNLIREIHAFNGREHESS